MVRSGPARVVHSLWSRGGDIALAARRSFVATIAFGVGVVLPMKGSEGCINFFTAFLVHLLLPPCWPMPSI